MPTGSVAGMRGAALAAAAGPASMNFASDNGAGVAAPILEAIVASSRVNAPAYGADDFTRRAEARLSRDLRDASVGLSRRHRHRRQRAVARRADPAVAGGLLPRRGARHRRRVRRAGILHRRRQGGRRLRPRRQDHAGDACRRRWRASRSARPRPASPARCRSARRPKPGPPTSPTRSPRWRRWRARRGWACTWTARASPMSSPPRESRRPNSPGGPASTSCRSARPRTARSPARR